MSFFLKTPEKSLFHSKTDQSGRSCRIKNQRSNYQPDSQRDKVHTNIACRSRTAWSWTPLMSSTAKPIYREKELIKDKDNTKIFNYPGKVCSLQRVEVPLYHGFLPCVLLLLGRRTSFVIPKTS